jgi:hypothetical protein
MFKYTIYIITQISIDSLLQCSSVYSNSKLLYKSSSAIPTITKNISFKWKTRSGGGSAGQGEFEVKYRTKE